MTYVTIYKAKDGWRWRALRGGRIVANGGESYTAKDKLTKSLDNFFASIANGSVKLKG